jgi:hypothetical protein
LAAISKHASGAESSEEGKQTGASPSLELLRDRLAQALHTLYNYRDTEFSKLVTWQGKASWLMYIGVLFIGLLAAFSNPILLLLGAVGGLISRVLRVVRGPSIPTDYGAFWTSLFASPLFGALAGWVGVTLILALTQLGLAGDVFKTMSWSDMTPPPVATATPAIPATPTPPPAASQTKENGVDAEPAIKSIACCNVSADPCCAQISQVSADINTNATAEAPPVNGPFLAWAIAILFGFSERLLPNATQVLEGALNFGAQDKDKGQVKEG